MSDTIYYHKKIIRKNWSGRAKFFNETVPAFTNIRSMNLIPIQKRTQFQGILIELTNNFATKGLEHKNFMEFFDNSIFYLELEGQPSIKLETSIDHLEIRDNKFYDRYLDKYSDQYVGKFCVHPFSLLPSQRISFAIGLGLSGITENLVVKVSLIPVRQGTPYIGYQKKCDCSIRTLWVMGCACGGV